MSAPFFLCLVGCVIYAAYAAHRRNLERTPAPYHLMHGPRSGCVECEGK